MPFISPLLGESVAANNTGDYQGYQIWVKGDGRVQVTQDLDTWIFNDVIDAQYWIDLREGTTAPPTPDVAPTLVSLDPTTAVLDSADVTMHCLGSGFLPTSVIVFAGQPEPIVFVSDTDISTVVKPSLGWGVVTVEVSVRNGTAESGALNFTFTETAGQRVAKAKTKK